MPIRKLTYTGLLTETSFNSVAIDQQEAAQLLQEAQRIPRQLLPFKGLLHVIDYTKGRHVAISGQVTPMFGFGPEAVMENGLGFVVDIFHKDDFKVYNETIFPKIVELLQATPLEHRGNLIFSFTYRLRRTDGRYNFVYQQGNYLTDVNGLPTHSIAVVQDITPIKKDESLHFSIDRKNEVGNLWGYENLFQANYQPNPLDASFSKREKEILPLLAEGLSSKQIAAKLYISEATVVIHRKNLLHKSGCRNIAELVHFAITKGYL